MLLIRYQIIHLGGVTMLQDLVIGKSYEVKTKEFQRPFVGKIKEVFEDYVLVEVEHCELIDRKNFKEKAVVKAQQFDIKGPMDEKYFFS